jgi:uncharacterized membrane protein YuzA (DUF378 family)
MKNTLFFTTIVICLIFILVVRYDIVSDYYGERLKNFQNILFIFISLSGLYTYMTNADSEVKVSKQRYVDTIIDDFFESKDLIEENLFEKLHQLKS